MLIISMTVFLSYRGKGQLLFGIFYSIKKHNALYFYMEFTSNSQFV
jgi:hypothetical protein